MKETARQSKNARCVGQSLFLKPLIEWMVSNYQVQNRISRFRTYLVIVSILLGITTWLSAQTIRVMPLGNSITFDENSLDGSNPRPDGDRISYRYRLYQLMHDAGYDVDYVGSENSGNHYFFNPELDDNAGFPGIETWQLANLINTGYNAVTGGYECSGPYLNYYPADIILLHIGTNALIESAYQVEDLLDNIRTYAPNAFILVARIINRRTYHSATTRFNNNVELMVMGRGDPRITMVNMETGAGINYSTDMIDNLHPNQIGYDKMGYKWFDAIQELNPAPVVTQIPDQYTDRGVPFDPISLDDFVEDSEDPDHLLTWTFTRKLGSQLNVTIDGNRNLWVTPNGDWSGSEVLTLKVTDTGSDAFPASQSMGVVFTVDKGNDPPAFESYPSTVINQEETYSYTVQATDIDGDSIIYSAVQKPSWLSFDEVAHQLSGVPHDQHVGIHTITLRVSDGVDYSDQSWDLEVIDVNDPPVFTSIPETEIDQGTYYSYVIRAEDADDDPLTYMDIQVPAWLQYNAQTRVISGVPGFDQVGVHDIVIEVSDGMEKATQSYQLTVVNSNDPPEFITSAVTEINQGANYYYNVIATDLDGDQLTYSVPQIPGWLSFDQYSRTLYGQPDNDDVGVHQVIVSVTDGYDTTDQDFQLTVLDVNDPPVFLTEPVTEARAYESYIYLIQAEDVDPGDELSFSSVVLPDWLTLSDGSADALLVGTPGYEHIGSHAVIIQVSDGTETVMQGYTVKVSAPTSMDNLDADQHLSVYPNPADDRVYFVSDKPGEMILHIYNSVGIILKSITLEYGEQFEVNISEFERGIYIYRAIINGQEETGKLIKK